MNVLVSAGASFQSNPTFDAHLDDLCCDADETDDYPNGLAYHLELRPRWIESSCLNGQPPDISGAREFDSEAALVNRTSQTFWKRRSIIHTFISHSVYSGAA